MPTRSEGPLRALAWLGFASACATPFVSGAVYRSVWIPLAQFWLGLGLIAAFLRSRGGVDQDRNLGSAVSRALLPVHALFALQLIPLPAAFLRLVGPGSHAAHFLPDPADGRFRPLSVSPDATVEAWLYFAGLQGLFFALRGFPTERRRGLLHALLVVILLLASEGLWQSRSAQPYRLYGLIEVPVPSGFETAVFGPYLNRNHFATPVAMGAGLAAGLAASLVLQNGGLIHLLSLPSVLSRVILLAGAAGFLAVTCAASGSRSGALAALAAIGFAGARTFGKRVLLATLGLGAITIALTGSATFERLMRLDIVSSRWAPWVDMTTLFRFFPLFGSGIGTFAAAYWPYQRNVSYEFWQYAHNDYLQWLIEGGVAGILVLVLVLRAIKQAVVVDAQVREACHAAALAFGAQALLDFPSHVPASAAILVTVFALATPGRPVSQQAPQT